MQPTKVDVGGQTYTIIYTAPGEPIIRGDDEVLRVGEVALGYCNAAEQTITIRGPGTNTGFHVTRDTLLHEIIHAAMALTNLANEMSSSKQESIVSRLAPVLLDVLRSNPLVVAYLTEKE